MKQLTNKKRRELNFNIGDLILVKLQPYRKTPFMGKAFIKLNRRYYGSYKILTKIKKVT